MIKHEQSGLWMNPDTHPHIWSEQNAHYRLLAPYLARGTVVDIGGHIGCFNRWARLNGAVSIRSYEPAPGNLEYARKNIPQNELHEVAVVSDEHEGESVTLYLSKTYGSKNTVEHVRGRPTVAVPVARFSQVVDGACVIKCDIEGGEYSLNWDKLPETVQALAFEFHFNKAHWLGEYEKLLETLRRQGFVAERVPKPNMYNKIAQGVFLR